MEKKKNSYFKAVSIISFIIGGFYVLDALSIFLEVSVGEYVVEAQGFVLAMGIITLGVAAYAIIQGVYFNKYSALTNEQASKYYKKCLAWSICALIFTGILNGILALVGHSNVIKAQKEEFEGVRPTQNQTAENQEISVEKLEKVKDRIEKLTELKISGAITEEEFNKMREKIMAEIKPVKKESKDPLDATTERLKKLQELKDSGAISEEEYNNLKNRIINKD